MTHFFLKMRYWFRFAAFLGILVIAVAAVRYIATKPPSLLAGKSQSDLGTDDAFQAALAASLANGHTDGSPDTTAGDQQDADQSGEKSANDQ